MCMCISLLITSTTNNQLMQLMSKAQSYLSSVRGVKFGVVFKAGFITRDAVFSYGTFLIVTTLLGQVHMSFFRF